MTAIHENIIQEIEVRIIDCGIHRILECLDKLSEESLDYRPNKSSNNISNLIVHLDGNVRQWLISTMSDVSDKRDRGSEFDVENKKSKSELIQILNKLESDIRAVSPMIIDVDLTARQDVQCYTETNLSIIIHVIEHFSYHVGQITYITKMLLDVDTGYYAGMDLGKVK